MQWMDGSIHWSPRIEKEALARAYRNDAVGLHDDDLLDDIGTALYLRCADILYIDDAQRQRWRCPRCEAANPPGPLMELQGVRCKDSRDNRYGCPACGLSMTWGEFCLNHKRKQLNPGGAVEAFALYVRQWPLCRETGEKFLCIDRLIHAFHYSLKARPDLPTRSAAVNLMQGKLYDIMVFLDQLSEGRDDPLTLRYRQEARRWKQEWSAWWQGMNGTETEGHD